MAKHISYFQSLTYFKNINITEVNELVDLLLEVIYRVRNIRGELSLPPKNKYTLYIEGDLQLLNKLKPYTSHISQLASLDQVHMQIERIAVQPTFLKLVVTGLNLFLEVEDEEQVKLAKLRLEKELENKRQYKNKVRKKKLSNEHFVKNASDEIVEKERSLLTDTNRRIEELISFLSE